MLCGAMVSLGGWSLDQFEKLGARQGPHVGLKGQKPLSTGKVALPPLFLFLLSHSL